MRGDTGDLRKETIEGMRRITRDLSQIVYFIWLASIAFLLREERHVFSSNASCDLTVSRCKQSQ
jgi:hypothetical protein